MHVKILGPIEVTSDGENVVLGGPKQRAVLGVLASRFGRVVSSDELIDAVWGDDLPANPLNTLQYQIAQLRKLLEDDASTPRRIVTRHPGYMLDASTTTLDAADFEALVADARAATGTAGGTPALDMIEQALGLWRGPALADFRYDDFATSEAVRLDDLRIGAEELRVDIALASGRHGDEIPRLTQLTINHPLREGLWTRLMIALYRDGQQTEALRAYQRVRDLLADVGVEPSEPLRSLEQQIIDQDPNLQAPPRTEARTRSNLPASPNKLIGRDTVIDELVHRIDDTRLITLTGPGGSGKTRLAIEVAGRSLDRFPGGVWFVPLDQIDEPALVPAFVGETLGIPESANLVVVDNLVNSLSARPTLLVLDNAEHVVEAVADLAASLLARCTSLQVIATSQAPLEVHSEVVFSVEPLTLPGSTPSIYDRFEDVDAVALFVDRARAAGTAVDEWDTSAYAAAANIVAALDGMPLAIELAAARTRAMSLEEIADGLQNRFDLLSKGPRDAPPRQRTLTGTMEWSMGLLTSTQRTIAQILSVCTGDFDTAAASSITGIAINELRDDLVALVDRSLLNRSSDLAGSARYVMIETVRHYGIRSMSGEEAAAARDAHLQAYATFAEAAADGICGPDQILWLARVDAEYANLRSAIAWSIESGNIETGLFLGANLGRYWDWKGYIKEASEWLMRLSDAAPADAAGLVGLIGWRSFLAWEFGDMDLARSLSDDAQSAAATTGDPLDEAIAMSTGILLARSSGDLDAARKTATETIARLDETGNPWMAAWAMSALATIAIADGDPSAASTYTSETISRFEELGDERGVGWGHTAQAQIDLMLGNPERACSNALLALGASSRTRDGRNVSWVLELLAEIAHAQGDFRRSARLWGAARPLRESRGLTTSISHQDDPIDLEESLRTHLGDAYDSLFAEGLADPESVVERELARRKETHTAAR